MALQAFAVVILTVFPAALLPEKSEGSLANHAGSEPFVPFAGSMRRC
jgi:hypothetical protein